MAKTMKVGILYIALGKYDRFFKEFYRSCEKFFLPDSLKMYYVWTDSDSPDFTNSNICKFPSVKLGWPDDTMLRFQKFYQNRTILAHNDVLFFFNANVLFNKPILESEVMPSSEFPLVGVEHPHFYNRSNVEFPYERDPVSKFSIPYGSGKTYYQGCFNGGYSEYFLEMSKILDSKIHLDVDAGHIPIWHDESALNWYYYQNHNLVKKLTPAYAYPESLNIPFEKKILQLDKSKLGGHDYLRS